MTAIDGDTYFKERLLEILPEEKDLTNYDGYKRMEAVGFNTCLAEIRKRAQL